jgi:sulfur carrier protein
MKLFVNGEERDFDSSLTLQELIDKLEIESKVMAAAVNMDVVKKEGWSNFALNDGDKIELLNFVGGG